MTREQVAEMLSRRFDAYKRRDVAALAADHADTSVVVSPMFATIQGRAASEGSYRALFTAFPDWEMRGEPPIIDGNRAAQCFHVSATHMSDMFGLPGTGKRIEMDVVIVLTLENGQIVHERRIYDFTSVLMQLGVLKGKLGK
jgi:steroid delta-isomerase-like uncharacterized protein